MSAGQYISKKQKSDDIQQAAQQGWVKESSMLKLLGAKKANPASGHIGFGEENSQAPDPILSSKMQVWCLGLGLRSIDPHWH